MSDKKTFSRFLSAVILFALFTAMALTANGCAKTNTESSSGPQIATFTLIVTDGDGNETAVTVTTDKKTVGAALLEQGIIENNSGPYGTYVKKVNGILADYDVTGTYWAFYINGEYAMTGVDSTNITDGATYSLKVEK